MGTGLLAQSEIDQIAAWHDLEFSDLPICRQYEWTIGGHFNVLLDLNDQFAGFVGVMRRDILINGKLTPIGGVRGLVIDRRWRGQGLGKVLMDEAHKVIFGTLKAEYGFLLCLSELEPFYRALNWRPVRSGVLVENKGESVPWTELAMLLNRERNSEPVDVDEIDLMGKAF